MCLRQWCLLTTLILVNKDKYKINTDNKGRTTTSTKVSYPTKLQYFNIQESRKIYHSSVLPPPILVPAMDSGEGDGFEDHILQRIFNVDCRLGQTCKKSKSKQHQLWTNKITEHQLTNKNQLGSFSEEREARVDHWRSSWGFH